MNGGGGPHRRSPGQRQLQKMIFTAQAGEAKRRLEARRLTEARNRAPVRPPGEERLRSGEDAPLDRGPDDEVAGPGWTEPDVEPQKRSEPRPALPSPRTFEPAGSGRVRVAGTAYHVARRAEPNHVSGRDTQILEFRVQLFDDEGSFIGEIPVELRGRSITGALTEGDHARLEGKWRRGVVRTRRVTIGRGGHTVGLVQALASVAPWQIALMVGMLIAFVAFALQVGALALLR